MIRGWTDDTRVQHTGQFQVVHIADPATDLADKINSLGCLSHNLIVSAIFDWRVAADKPMEAFACHQVPIACLPATAGIADDAIAYLQINGGSLRFQLFESERQQVQTRFGSGQTQGVSACFERAAAGRAAFIGRHRCIGSLDAYAVEVDIQLIGSDLCQRGLDALPQFDLAAENGYATIGVETQPTIQFGILQQRWRKYSRLGLVGQGRRRDHLVDRLQFGAGRCEI